jgi:hypothetical protein
MRRLDSVLRLRCSNSLMDLLDGGAPFSYLAKLSRAQETGQGRPLIGHPTAFSDSATLPGASQSFPSRLGVM